MSGIFKQKQLGWRVRVQWRWGLGCPCGPSGEVLCNLLRLVALVLCGIRCPGGRAVEIRGGHFWRVRLPLQPDLWFWISPSCWYSRIGTQFGDEAPPGRSALALKMIYVWTQLIILNNMRYYKSRMCGFFSVRPFVGKQGDINRTLPCRFVTHFPPRRDFFS